MKAWVHNVALVKDITAVTCYLIQCRKSGQFTQHLWKRYVDDTFTVLLNTPIMPILDHLNGIKPSIKFTVVEERVGQLAFRDVLLLREDDSKISTSVYRKASHTNQYLSSGHSIQWHTR